MATTLNPNQFSQSQILGMVDMRQAERIISAQADSTSGTLVPGKIVELIDSAGGAPKVKESNSNTDTHFGVVVYSNKDASFVAGDAVEIMQRGCIIMRATAAIARGAQVKSVVATTGGVATADSASKPIGWALDKAAADGDLIRVYLDLPAFTTLA